MVLRIALGAVALGALFLVGRWAGGYVPRFAEWVRTLGALGPAVFVAGYAVATIGGVPGSLLTLAAGAIFGLWAGTLWVLLGATLGASGAFLVARYLAREAVERRVLADPRFAAIDRAIAEQGRRVVFLLRLSPAVPFTLLNYLLGLTRVRFVDFLAASLGMLPGTMLYVYAGQVAGQLAATAGGASPPRGTGYWVVLALGLLATVAVTVLVTRAARRALRGVGDAGTTMSEARP